MLLEADVHLVGECCSELREVLRCCHEVLALDVHASPGVEVKSDVAVVGDASV